MFQFGYFEAAVVLSDVITKTRLFKYIENFTTKYQIPKLVCNKISWGADF